MSAMTNLDTFNYEISKKKYFKLLKSSPYIRKKYFPHNEESKKELISFVKTKLKPYFMKFEIVKDNDNRELLILRRRIPSDPIVEVLAASECFDIFAEIHLLENHASFKEILATLKPIYHIYRAAIAIFIKSCNICYLRDSEEKLHVTLRNEKPFIPKFTVLCTIMRSQFNLDSRFSHIVVCIDALTNYIVIRPTYSKDPHVVAYELLKIFLDFGLPEIFIVRDGDVFYEDIMQILKSVNIFSSLPIILCKIKLDKLDWASEKITDLLKSWIETRSCSNWAIGLKEIQWHINNIMDYKILKSRKIKLEITSPYLAHFGFLPNRKCIEQQKLSGSETVLCGTEQYTKHPAANDKIKNLDENCVCNNNIYTIFFKKCVICGRKCHFNCCVISVVELPPRDRYLQAKCKYCDLIKEQSNTD